MSTRMIKFTWYFFAIVWFLVVNNQAFLNAPIPAHAVSSYSIGADRRLDSNKVNYGANDNHHQSAISSLKTDDEKDGDDDDDDDGNNGGKTVYVIAYEGNTMQKERDQDTEGILNKESYDTVNLELHNPLDPWSIVWYIGSFGGLVAFFLIVSCSEWCCRRGRRPYAMSYAQHAETINTPGVTETPPPPYHLFAPPSYDSVNYNDIIDKTTGEKLDIFVISMPIHRPIPQMSA